MPRRTSHPPMSLAARVADALECGEFQLLVLSRPLSPRMLTHKVTVRPVQFREDVWFQWAARIGDHERHENLSAEELVRRVRLGFITEFGDAHLFTLRGDYTARSVGGGEVKWKIKPPSKTDAKPAAHNREKMYLIPDGKPCPFLREIGVMSPGGQVYAAKSAKFRQINRYLEFVDDIVPALPAEAEIRVVDFGCGKSYLTFAVHYLLTAIYRRDVHITGLDLKTDVIAHCADIARKLHCTGLEFRAGDIASFSRDGLAATQSGALRGASRLTEGLPHLAISLHACDTATDDAIAAAIGWGCQVILAAPCCQHEIRQQMTRDAIPGLTDFGLFRERFAAMATDALRAQYLEAAGYKTQVLEFIDLEHTPKNVLLRAVRRHTPDPAAEAEARENIARLKSLLGIESWRLDQLAPPQLAPAQRAPV